MTTLLRSVTLPIDGYLSLAWDRGKVCVAATIPGRPWTFYELSRDLTILRSFTGGVNPSGPPQLFAENDWRWAEMKDGGQWDEWGLTFNGDVLMEPTGRGVRGGKLQWRDSHVLSWEGAGHIERDGVVIVSGPDVGAACIAGEWTIWHNHANTRLTRRAPDGNIDTRYVPAFLFGQAQIAEDGTVVYSEFPTGKVSVWTPNGTILDGEMPPWTEQNPNWAWAIDHGENVPIPESVSVYWLCSGHNGRHSFIGSDSENGSLLLERPSEPFARACMIEDAECAIATWDSIAKVIRVDTLSLDQAFGDPVDPGVPLPPVDPPVPPMDPPKPVEPPKPTLPDPVLLVSPASGVAPLEVLAVPYYLSEDGPVTFAVRAAGETNWRVAAVAPVSIFNPPDHVYQFPSAGSYELMASGSGRQTNIQPITVTAPPAPKPNWLAILLALFRRGR
jgi:hypothetical protein